MRENDHKIQMISGDEFRTICILQPYTGAHAFHMSGKKNIQSPMIYRREGVSMELPAFSEYENIRIEEKYIREARMELL